MPPRAVVHASRKSTRTRASVKFGSWLRLYSEDQLLAELSIFGLTLRSFRSLLHNLHVPTLHIGKIRFVDGYSFFLALRAVLSIGEPDFHAPGCSTVFFRNADPSHLDLTRFRLNQRRLVADLLYSKRFNGLTLTDGQLKKTARLAISRIQATAYRIALSTVLSDQEAAADSHLLSVRRGEPPDAPTREPLDP